MTLEDRIAVSDDNVGDQYRLPHLHDETTQSIESVSEKEDISSSIVIFSRGSYYLKLLSMDCCLIDEETNTGSDMGSLIVLDYSHNNIVEILQNLHKEETRIFSRNSNRNALKFLSYRGFNERICWRNFLKKLYYTHINPFTGFESFCNSVIKSQYTTTYIPSSIEEKYQENNIDEDYIKPWNNWGRKITFIHQVSKPQFSHVWNKESLKAIG